MYVLKCYAIESIVSGKLAVQAIYLSVVLPPCVSAFDVAKTFCCAAGPAKQKLGMLPTFETKQQGMGSFEHDKFALLCCDKDKNFISKGAHT